MNLLFFHDDDDARFDEDDEFIIFLLGLGFHSMILQFDVTGTGFLKSFFYFFEAVFMPDFDI